jgi:hypothetical protein
MYKIKDIDLFVREGKVKPLYVGVFLDYTNKNKLLKAVPAEHDIITADHVTVQFKVLDDWKKHELTIGQTIEINVIGYASNEEIQAVAVDTSSNAKNSHITISYTKGTNPVLSDKLLSDVAPTKLKLKLKGRVGVYMTNGTVSYNEDI